MDEKYGWASAVESANLIEYIFQSAIIMLLTPIAFIIGLLAGPGATNANGDIIYQF
jgi:hypothetical protein